VVEADARYPTDPRVGAGRDRDARRRGRVAPTTLRAPTDGAFGITRGRWPSDCRKVKRTRAARSARRAEDRVAVDRGGRAAGPPVGA
jgi:hypothetical protein